MEFKNIFPYYMVDRFKKWDEIRIFTVNKIFVSQSGQVV